MQNVCKQKSEKIIKGGENDQRQGWPSRTKTRGQPLGEKDRAPPSHREKCRNGTPVGGSQRMRVGTTSRKKNAQEKEGTLVSRQNMTERAIKGQKEMGKLGGRNGISGVLRKAKKARVLFLGSKELRVQKNICVHSERGKNQRKADRATKEKEQGDQVIDARD